MFVIYRYFSRTLVIWISLAVAFLCYPYERAFSEREGKKMELQSDAFRNDKPIPPRYTGDSEDISPRLSWSNVPSGTKELALVVDDPDAPSPKPWVHWVLYKIPPTANTIPEGVPMKAVLTSPPGAVQGKNSWGTVGYRGPKPPEGDGTHHYRFTIYALKVTLPVEKGMHKDALMAAISDQILGQAELVGTYQR